MSRDTFLQLKTALENDEPTFEISTHDIKTRCMVYKHGKCNFVYGFDVKVDCDYPLLDINDAPHLIAISDAWGHNITLVSRYNFVDREDGFEYDELTAPHSITNRVTEMNDRLFTSYVAEYSTTLTLNDFDNETAEHIQRLAAKYARESAINGKANMGLPLIIHTHEYLAIRSGFLDEIDVVRDYCKCYKQGLLTKRFAEEALEQGVLDETETALAETLRNIPKSAKLLTVNIERDGERPSRTLKIDPADLHNILLHKHEFSVFDFKSGGNSISTMNNVAHSNPLTIYDIESITHGKQTLYSRDDNKATAKEKKRAGAYER